MKGNAFLTLLLMQCFLPLYLIFDSIHPLFMRQNNRKSKFLWQIFCMVKYSQFPNLQDCPRTWCPLDHTLRHSWKHLVLAVKIILKTKQDRIRPPPLHIKSKVKCHGIQSQKIGPSKQFYLICTFKGVNGLIRKIVVWQAYLNILFTTISFKITINQMFQEKYNEFDGEHF